MTVPQSHSHSHEQRPAVKRALCLVDKETLCRVKETIELLGWRLDEVDTISEAVNALQFDKYEAVITAISTSKASLFDESTFDERSRAIVYKSSFLQLLRVQAPSTFRIVYGFEVVELDDIRQACYDCGADAVVNSQEGLFDLLFGLGAPAPKSTSTSRDTSARQVDQLVQLSRGSSPTPGMVHCQQLQLQSPTVSTPNAASLGSGEPTTQQMPTRPESPTIFDLVRDPTDEMPFEIMVPSCSDFVPPLLEDESCRNLDFSEYKSNIYRASGTGPRVRVVHVSDTIGLHRRLVLPEGDVFLHAGNFTNGKPHTWLSQFVDFLDWIHDEVLSSFRQVAFIAGSNDIFLDTIACKYNAASREAQKILNRFLSAHESVAFLENSSITYRGLKIHGSSTTLLKGDDDDEGNTTEGKHGAFERELKGFFRPEIDDECDILLTHRPPSFLFPQPSYELLTDRLYHTEVDEEQTHGPNQVGKKKLSFSFRKNALSDSQRGMKEEESTRSFPLLFRKENPRATTSTGLQTKQKQAPRVHAFGHYGKDFGVEFDTNTLLLNGSQDRFLQSEKDCRGIPLAVDVPLFR